MALMKLQCPSCAAALDLPDNLTVAHCMYCGTKILLDPEHGLRDQKAIKNFVELCDALLAAKNYTEVVVFANKALERDPKNVDAWVYKARATSWLSTRENDRYDEAMSYVGKAETIAPDSDRVIAARQHLFEAKAAWLKERGAARFQVAQEIYNNLCLDRPGHKGNRYAASVASQEPLKEALRYFCEASDLQPDDIQALEGIEKVTRDGTRIARSYEVQKKLAHLEFIRRKPPSEQRLAYARKRLPVARIELEGREKALAALKTKTGVVANLSRVAVERTVGTLRAEIANLSRELNLV
jgi:tetratricopeptide (TPR) repeat protein